MLAVTPSRLQF